MIGKRLRKNNPTITLNILHTKEKEICPAHISKCIWNCEKKCINDSKRRKRRMALSCSKKTVYTIKRSSIKTSW